MVEVAPTVRTALASAEEVPTPTMSVSAVRETLVPESVQPEATPPVLSSVPQTMSPKALVSKAPAPVQEIMFLVLIPPATTMPPAKVEEAVEALTSNAPPSIDMPPANVEVAVPEALMPDPNCRSLATERVFVKVEEAKEVSPFNAEVVEAERAPVTLRFWVKVELAFAASPP